MTLILVPVEWSFVDIGGLIFQKQHFVRFKLSMEELPEKYALLLGCATSFNEKDNNYPTLIS